MLSVNRCLHCMEEKRLPGVCAYCGVDDQALANSLNALAPKSLLNGRYLIGRTLGSGGFGNTYLAFELNLQSKLAIKEYMPYGIALRHPGTTMVSLVDQTTSGDYQTGLDKFLEEARTLSKFNSHPGIVSIRDFFHENNTAYIVMEYVDGVTLKEYVRQKGGNIALETMLEVARPLMDSLRQVHEVGMMHRDISPDNIYITKERQVKLLDFGASRHAMKEASKSLSVILKPGYAPEEQYRARGKQGAWTDVYALAATIYHCVSGKLPTDSLDRLEEDTLEPLSKVVKGVPAYVDEALMKALAIRGKDRFQTMEAFQRALKLYREPVQESVVVTPQPTPQVAPVQPVAIPGTKEESTSTPNSVPNAPKVEDKPVEKVSKKIESVSSKSAPSAERRTNGDRKGFGKAGLWTLISFLSVIIVVASVVTWNVVESDSDSAEVEVTRETIPNVDGKQLADAKRLLEDAGFVVGEIKEEKNFVGAQDEVIRSDPKADESVAKGSKINLLINKIEIDSLPNQKQPEPSDGWIYYYNEQGIYRVKTDETVNMLLKKGIIPSSLDDFTLPDGKIQFRATDGNWYEMKRDGSDFK